MKISLEMCSEHSKSGGFTSNTPPSKTDFSFLEGGILRKILRKKTKCGGACGRLSNMFIEVSIMLSDYYLMHTYTHSINKLSINHLIFSLGNPSPHSRNTFLPYMLYKPRGKIYLYFMKDIYHGKYTDRL